MPCKSHFMTNSQAKSLPEDNDNSSKACTDENKDKVDESMVKSKHLSDFDSCDIFDDP